MDRKEIAEQFYMEEHAVLYALLVKAARELYGDKGELANGGGTIQYGRERGRRMALRALKDGEDLSPKNYLLYSEWVDDRKWSKKDVYAISPAFTTHCTHCGWCESWKKHGLLEYGNLYCSHIDVNLVKGFNPDNVLNIRSVLSQNGPCCDFEFEKVSFANQEELDAFNAKKRSLKDHTVKDFLYHTASELSAMDRVYQSILGKEAAEKVVSTAIAGFREKFGEEKTAALLEEAKQDFTVID